MVLQLAVSHLRFPIHLVGLLLTHLLLNLSFLLVGEDVRRSLYIGQVALPLSSVICQLDLSLQLHLVKELVPHERLLLCDSLSLPIDELLRLLRAEVRLIILPRDFFLHRLALTVRLHLLSDVAEVVKVVPASQVAVMLSDHVGLVLLPAELLALELTIFFDPLTLVLEAVMCLSVGLGNIGHELPALAVGVVVDLEGALGAHEVRVGGRVVTSTDLLAVECQADDGANIVWIVIRSIGLGCRIVTVGFEQTVSGTIESVHVLQRLGVHSDRCLGRLADVVQRWRCQGAGCLGLAGAAVAATDVCPGIVAELTREGAPWPALGI